MPGKPPPLQEDEAEPPARARGAGIIAELSGRLAQTTLKHHPPAFISRKGEPMMIVLFEQGQTAALKQMYLAFEPKGCFQGLPPHKESVCIAWVEDMIAGAFNLLALSFAQGVVGHCALFPISTQACEMLVVVSPAYQNLGIGTELTRACLQLAHELCFEKMELSVEDMNMPAKHVYKKCGFECASFPDGELAMVIDLGAHRKAVGVKVAEIMNRQVVSVGPSQSCAHALGIFLQSHFDSLPVVNEDGRLVGILSKSDLIEPRRISRPIREVCTRQVLTAQAHWPIARVIRLFRSTRIRCVPVVDAQDKLCGVIGREDVLAHYMKLFADQRQAP